MRGKRTKLGDNVRCKRCGEFKLYTSHNFYPSSRGHTCKLCVKVERLLKSGRSLNNPMHPRTHAQKAMLGEMVACNVCSNVYPYTSRHFYPALHGHKCKPCVHRQQYEYKVKRRAAARQLREYMEEVKSGNKYAEENRLRALGYDPDNPVFMDKSGKAIVGLERCEAPAPSLPDVGALPPFDPFKTT